MFTFNPPRRFPAPVAFALLALCALLAFSGCPTGTTQDTFVDDHQLNRSLIGTWKDVTAGDGYTIADTTLSYDDGGWGGGYAGTIKYVSNFSSNAGVIIIEYDDGHKPTYPIYDENWNPIGTHPLKGNFLGIYYKELKPGVSVRMGHANIVGGAEEATLDAAKAAFTQGKEGTYMTFYGTYPRL